MPDKTIGQQLDEALKAGARHSHSDQSHIDQAVDHLIQAGGAHPRLMSEAPPMEWTPEDPAKALITFGTEVKALGGGKVGGYLVRFSTANDPDLTGDFFTAETDFGDFKAAPVLYQHGLDAKMGKRKLGSGDLKKDDVGVWIEAQLALRDDYEKAVYEMAAAGKLGWSSGTASHLVERAPEGKAARITAWPLGLDASLTPHPAEPRNAAQSLKAYMDMLTADTPAAKSADIPAPADSVKTVLPVEVLSPQENHTMTTETQAPAPVDTSVLDAIKALTAEVTALKAAAPVQRTPGVAGMIDEGKAPAQIAPALSYADDQLYELKSFLNRELDEDSRRLWREQQAKIRQTQADSDHVKAYHAYLRNPGDYGAAQNLRQAAMKTALAEGTASLGGNLVPVLYSNQLVSTLKEESILRRAGAYQFPIAGTNALKVATLTRSASAALVAEGASVAGQEPTFGVVSFDAYAYKATAVASRESIADSRFDVAAILNENFGWQFTQSENNQFGIGTGSSQPQGIAVGATMAVSGGSTLALATANHDKFLDLYHALPYQYRTNAVWFMNDAVIKAVRASKWATTTGAGSTTTYNQFLLTVDNTGDSPVAPFGRFMGRPIFPLNTMASSGSTGAVAVFADPRFFWISDFALGGTEIQQLNERWADNWQVGWNAWRRFDSNLMVSEAAQSMKLL